MVMQPAGQHLAQPGLAALLAHELDDRHAVLRRVGVRHRDDRGEPAERRGAAAGLDGLGLLLAGLAQVHVQVDEAGADDAAGGVEHGVGRRRQRSGADLDDAAVLDGDVAGAFAASGRGRCRR